MSSKAMWKKSALSALAALGGVGVLWVLVFSAHLAAITLAADLLR